jgi:hypothetical protein
MAQTDQPEGNTTQVTAKSGKGNRDGVVSELFTIWEVKPGHEEELRAATERLANGLKSLPVEVNVQTGLRDERHVIFDGGKRLAWFTTFDTDWDPYVEDAFMRIGIDNFTDWIQHLTAADEWFGYIREAGGEERFRAAPNITGTAQEKEARAGLSWLKKFLSDHQVPASGFYKAMSYITHAEVRKAQRVNEAFQQVLDDPDAAEALQHPALKPLLEQAAD